MEKTKVFLSDDVVNFINNFNKITTAVADKMGERKEAEMVWINYYFKSTDEPNIYEILTEVDLITHFCKSTENTERGITSIKQMPSIKYGNKD